MPTNHQRKTDRKKGFILTTYILSIVTVLCACTPQINNRGNDVDLDNLVEIEPGKTRKSKVAALLGSPSTVSEFGTETWIYISGQTETVAFFAEKELKRKVIYIAFDKKGFVDSIGKLSEKDGKKIEIVNRKTPTAGQRITMIQQLIGNIGRFNTTENQ